MSVERGAEGERVCIGCGCSDRDPCEEGCGWLMVDGDVGVCTNCPHEQLRFKLGHRELSVDAEEMVTMREEMG